MAVIHRTTMAPTKLELLIRWLPAQEWFGHELGEPSLARAGGFRLDDPAGDVGIEFMIVRDDSAREQRARSRTAYHVPMTYRGAPLADAEDALIGTSRHGVLGLRWIYDGTADPVLLAALTGLIRGRAQAQAAGQSNTPDATVQVEPAPAPDGGDLSISFARMLVPLDPPPPAAAAAQPDATQVTALWAPVAGSEIRSTVATAQPLAQ